MEQGWRAYYIDNPSRLTLGNNLHVLAIRNLIQVVTYENRKIVFVKDAKPIENGKD